MLVLVRSVVFVYVTCICTSVFVCVYVCIRAYICVQCKRTNLIGVWPCAGRTPEANGGNDGDKEGALVVDPIDIAALYCY